MNKLAQKTAQTINFTTLWVVGVGVLIYLGEVVMLGITSILSLVALVAVLVIPALMTNKLTLWLYQNVKENALEVSWSVMISCWLFLCLVPGLITLSILGWTITPSLRLTEVLAPWGVLLIGQFTLCTAVYIPSSSLENRNY